MSICLSLRRAAGFVCALALAVVAAPVPQSSPDAPLLVSHSRISVHRDENGALKQGPRNEIETSNWSGYVAANFLAPHNTYTQAQATWTVPKVSYVAPPPVCHVYNFGGFQYKFCSPSSAKWEYSSSWVGVGGYCEDANCTSVDNTLIQLGTEQDASKFGTTQYYAWIEMLPNAPIVVSSTPGCNSLSCAAPVHPGDVITASLTCAAGCAPGTTQTWTLSMSNITRKWNFETSVSYASTLLSAEWIEEAPSSSAGVLPLANYGTAKFAPTMDEGQVPGFDMSNTDANAIQMVDPYGETSNPSSADGNDVFNTCWGNNPSSFTACPTPP